MQGQSNLSSGKQSDKFTPLKSIEGWIIIVTNLHQESQQDDVYDSFSRFGQIKGIHLNMDRKSGYAKGYALIQYANQQQAKNAIQKMNNQQIYQKQIKVDWAFREKPITSKIN